MNDDADPLAQLRIAPEQRAGGPRRRRWPWLAGGALLALAVAAAAVLVLNARAVEVETVPAQPASGPGGAAAVLEAAGYVTARREATVSSKVTGKVASVSIEEGDRVEEGQVLARLDDADQQAQLALARAQVAAAGSQLGSLEAQLEQARRDLKRQQALGRRGLAAEQALEDAATSVDSYSAQLAAQRSQVAVTEAQLHIARVNQEDTVIRAPFTGVVVAKAAQPGEIVSPISGGGGFTRTGICTVVDMNSLEIEVDVNEAYINRVRPGQPVTAVLDAYPEWKIPAEVIAIVPTADRSKATVKVRIALKARDPRIVPDMGIRVSFLEDKSAGSGAPAGAVLIPSSALVERDGASVAFVVEGDRARIRKVTPGDSYGDLRVVDKGLASGERVVRDPPPQLRDGMRVKANLASNGNSDG
jgi:RND family efflux transporter MFP subunit